MLIHPDDIVFLFDVDNTLLDNDKVVADLNRHLIERFGADSASHYWAIYEALRTELGYSDYLGALQHYRLDRMNDPDILQMSLFLLDYPFADSLYPGAKDVLVYLAKWGKTVILSDGDVVFQPRKIQRSGLWDVVEGRVLIYIHKEKMLDDIIARYPARHYVMVDDKLRVLAAMKSSLGARLTTVFPRQGHYAQDPGNAGLYRPADITINHIGDLVRIDVSEFAGAQWADIHARSNLL